jgi:hypothetical protein
LKGKKNKSKTRKKDYREYYNDRTKGIVENLYKADIDKLKYEF